MATLKLEAVLTKTEDSGVVRAIPVPAMIFDFKEGEEQQAIIDDSTIVTPKVVDLTETNAITAVILWAVYKDTDAPANITAGDIAPFLVERNASGIWERIEKILIVGGGLTSLKYKKANTIVDGRKIIVKRIICAAGI